MKIHRSKHYLALIFILCLPVFIFAKQVETSRKWTKPLSVPGVSEGFSFVILGDRTTGNEQGLDVLRQAVGEINSLRPDFVICVGDLIQGYNEQKEWVQQAKQFKKVAGELDMPFMPVAGNHDVYWRGEGRPPREHEADYEKAFGPLWYAFEYKGSCFVVLFTDEGDPVTGEKDFRKASAQTMSDGQINWLKATLKKASGADHIFVFLHHPRWVGGGYGQDWDRVHDILKKAGNVSAVFAGHTHSMRYYGKEDGIDYYTLGTTGGQISEEQLKRQAEHHYFVVNAAAKKYTVSMVPVGEIQNPRIRPPITLRPKTQWKIGSEAKRRLEFPVHIDTFGVKETILDVGVGHAADDSGDEGLWVMLLDAERKLLKKEFSKSEGVKWVNYKVQQGQTYTVVLEDKDTQFTGSYPGNGGSIQISLELQDE